MRARLNIDDVEYDDDEYDAHYAQTGSSPKMGGKQARTGDYYDEQPISVCKSVKHLPFL